MQMRGRCVYVIYKMRVYERIAILLQREYHVESEIMRVLRSNQPSFRSMGARDHLLYERDGNATTPLRPFSDSPFHPGSG